LKDSVFELFFPFLRMMKMSVCQASYTFEGLYFLIYLISGIKPNKYPFCLLALALVFQIGRPKNLIFFLDGVSVFLITGIPKR
jgi:hypothetical protein